MNIFVVIRGNYVIEAFTDRASAEQCLKQWANDPINHQPYIQSIFVQTGDIECFHCDRLQLLNQNPTHDIQNWSNQGLLPSCPSYLPKLA